jgi:hypothetical protein
LPGSLWVTVHDLRLSADNVHNDCAVRIKSLEKLCRIAGYSCAVHHGDEIDTVIDRELGLSKPETRDKKLIAKRLENRNAALEEIRHNLINDANRLAGLPITELAAALRYDDGQPYEPAKPVSTIDPELRARMDRVLGR